MEGKLEGNFGGNKSKSEIFSLNLGGEMELFFEPFNTGDFQQYVWHPSQKQNLGKISRELKKGYVEPYRV